MLDRPAVTTLDDGPREMGFGRSLLRPLLAYIAILVLGVWILYAAVDLGQGSDLAAVPLVAAGSLLGYGLFVVLFLSLLQIPAVALTITLIHRLEAGSRGARAIVGAGSWAAWCLFVGLALAIASGVVVQPGTLATDLLLFAGAGALFAVLAFDGHERRVGPILALLSVAVGILVVLGSLWMAGRWGGPA